MSQQSFSKPSTTSNSSPSLKAPTILEVLSKPRTGPYKLTFKPSSDEAHLGAYYWAQAIAASLHPFVGFAEIALRNAIHRSLSYQCSLGQSTSYAWYDKAMPNSVTLRGKSLEKIEQQLSSGEPPLRKINQPTPDAVIAELSFGFWPNVMEGLSQKFAPKTFTDVFPNHPHSKPQHWSQTKNKEIVILRIKRLQDLRNRVCHFEPVWKPHWLGIDDPTNKNWSHSVKALRDLHKELLELLDWCSADAVIAYKSTFGWNWFNKLCTTNAVKAFMSNHESCALLPTIEWSDAKLEGVSTETVKIEDDTESKQNK